MLRKLFTLLLSSFAVGALNAQDFVQVATGAGYSQQAYYNIETDEVKQLANDSWDLAFSTTGMFDVGISVNESTTSVTGVPAPELKVYLASATSFTESLDTSKLEERLFNDESSWENGALNSVADPSNPFDFGWGLYNPTSHTLAGNRVFAVELRDGSFKKFIIESYAGGTYTIKYANFDGSQEMQATIAKSNFSDTPLAFFSFASGETLPSIGPWDLFFGRYTSKLDDGTGNLLDYPVTGVLSAPGVEVAEARGVDPATVNFEEYQDSLQSRLDVIGHDWKAFSFTEGWVIPSDLAYFVKTEDNHVYKLVFIDFEGASSGVSTFEKADLGVVAVSHPNSNFAEATIYPNPVVREATVTFSLKQAQNNLQLSVRDLAGRVLWRTSFNGIEGYNLRQLPALNLPKGAYLLSIAGGKDVLTLKMMQQ